MMAAAKQGLGCPRCAELETRVAALEAQLAAALKNSGNSSKPPSSDLVKPPKANQKPGRPKKRKIGGQPGHPRYERIPFAPDELDKTWVWYYDGCPCCGGKLRAVEQPPRVLQNIELLTVPLRIEQHESRPRDVAQAGRQGHSRLARPV